jgi:mono/diheme cytochrome c family protein
MKTATQRDLARRRVLFAILLAVIVIVVVYTAFQNRPWNVPEDAKRMRNPLPPSERALTSARVLYDERCAHCHGATGKGDGKDASQYDPRPTNFSDATRLNTETDGEVFYKISEGKKPMPSFRKRFTEEQRWQLVLLLRSFAVARAEPADVSGSSSSTSRPRP